MTLLWCDGFEHYGGDIANLTDGAWAEAPSLTQQFTLSASNVRTGSYCLHRGNSSVAIEARRVLGGAKTFVVVGCAVRMSKFLSVDNEACLVDFRDANNTPNISVGCQSDGKLVIRRGGMGTGTTLFESESAVFLTGVYQYLEVAVQISDTVGQVEVRWNGVTKASLADVNTVAGLSECSQVAFPGKDNTGVLVADDADYTVQWDDIYVCDDSGNFNNSFLGVQRVYTLLPNRDTEEAEWTYSTGPGFENINDDTVDDDTTRLTAPKYTSPSEISSRFWLEDLPESTGLISGASTFVRARKEEAGSVLLQTGLVGDNSSEVVSSEFPINSVYTYVHNIFEYDPDTGASFTADSINDIELKLIKVGT